MVQSKCHTETYYTQSVISFTGIIIIYSLIETHVIRNILFIEHGILMNCILIGNAKID